METAGLLCVDRYVEDLTSGPLGLEKFMSYTGEETGGGAYGNSAWLIPDVTLPNTKVRFRLPLFRLVIDRNAEKGRGVVPEVPVLPTVDALRKNVDYKIEKVKALIREKAAQ